MAESNCEGESKHLQLELEVTATQNIDPHTDSLDATPTTDRAMMSDTPKSVMKLDPSEYMKVSWDTMRCLYLLWEIGIAHGDVSLVNKMYKESEQGISGTFNDIDLVTEMKLTCRSPDKKGWERTGTLPFMALDPLEFCLGEIKRRFRHDLESGTWCLAWQMVYEESEQRFWYTGALDDIFNHKHILLDTFNVRIIKEDWRNYFRVMRNWLSECSALYRQLNSLTTYILSETEAFNIRENADMGRKDEDLIRSTVKLAKAAELDSIDALYDISWIDLPVQLLTETHVN